MYKITSTMTNLNYCRINVRGYFSVLDNSYFTKTSNAQCPLSQNESCETYALYRDLGSIHIVNILRLYTTHHATTLSFTPIIRQLSVCYENVRSMKIYNKTIVSNSKHKQGKDVYWFK